jgi:hypothetical protein
MTTDMPTSRSGRQGSSFHRSSERMKELNGVNLLPLLRGETGKLATCELCLRFGLQHTVRQGDWKLVNLSTGAEEQKDHGAGKPAEK